MANSLVDVIDEIQKEYPNFSKEDILNAVNTAQKGYQPEQEKPENLNKIKENALSTLNFSAML